MQLTNDEAEVLCDQLVRDLGDLRFEIADTERLEHRKTLKHREDVIKALIARLEVQLGAAA